MITPAEIETLGRKLADLWVADDTHAARLDEFDHLEGDDLDAVLTRAQDISFDRSLVGDGIDEVTSESLTRLARATGCPLSEPIIPWLQQHGLLEEVDGVLRFKPAKPGKAGA
jgi:hypothetical protein